MKKILFGFFAFSGLIAKGQNVGIGTTTPLEKLSVVSAGGYGISHESSSIKLSTYIDGTGGYLGTVTNNPFHLYTNNGAAQFTLLQNGNVGVGLTIPLHKLHVNGNIFSTAEILTPGNISAGGDVTAVNFNFPSPKTYYYSLSGADFKEVNSGNAVQTEGISGGGIYMSGGSSATGFVAPVHLPENATVTRMTVSFNDVSAAVNLDVVLRKSDLFTIMAQVVSSGTPGETSLIDNTITNPGIFNANAFVVYAVPAGGQWPGNSLILRRVTIEYTLPGF